MPTKGYKLTEEHKRKIGLARMGKSSGMKGRKKAKDAYSFLTGNKNPNWKGGKSKLYTYKHICDIKWRLWRSKVFGRDNWTCQTCGKRSQSGEPVYLEAHHIKSWTNYPELRYEVDNGITLCRECHLLTRKNNG